MDELHNEINLKIALFMGAKIDGEYPDHVLLDMGKERKQNQRFWASNTLKYHKSWDWLMPVVTKLEKEHNADIVIGRMHCLINEVVTADPVGSDKLLGVYYGINRFINELRD